MFKGNETKPVPEIDFAGMTETECPAACKSDPAAMAAAQRSLNELEAQHPRQVRFNKPRGPVMELDAEYLQRVPAIAAEYRQLSAIRDGAACAISGGCACGHPAKGGIQSKLATPEVIARFERAKKFLQRRKLDLGDGKAA
jgi:hypothetical protein